MSEGVTLANRQVGWTWERGLLGKGNHSRCQGYMGRGHSVSHGVRAECKGTGTRSERASDVMLREPLKVFKYEATR